MKMDVNKKAWRKVLAVIGNGRSVTTKLRPRPNWIRPCDGHLIARSKGNNSVDRPILEKDVVWYARLATNAGAKGRCIKNLPGEPPRRVGSIICSLLDLLPEFEYRSGQIIAYFGPR